MQSLPKNIFKLFRVLVLVLIVIDLVILNFVFFDYWNSSKNRGAVLEDTPVPQIANYNSESQCCSDVKSYIDSRFSEIDLTTPQPLPTSKPPVVYKPIATTTTSVDYIVMSGSGSVLNNDWTDINGTNFYFDPAEYPGIYEVRFETNIKLTNGNGMAYFRIFDVTHSIGVVNSETSTNKQSTDNVTSGVINFWAGRNLYKVQAKTLTADTAVFEGGRLRIISKN